MVVALEGMIGLAARISSTVVLKWAARACSVSPVWAIYSTSSPGEYAGRAEAGVGAGISTAAGGVDGTSAPEREGFTGPAWQAARRDAEKIRPGIPRRKMRFNWIDTGG
jgi:hypothetical protein